VEYPDSSTISSQRSMIPSALSSAVDDTAGLAEEDPGEAAQAGPHDLAVDRALLVREDEEHGHDPIGAAALIDGP